jgi:hypothetical protein
VTLDPATAQSLVEFLTGLAELTGRTGWRVAEYGSDYARHETAGVLRLCRTVDDDDGTISYEVQDVT